MKRSLAFVLAVVGALTLLATTTTVIFGSNVMTVANSQVEVWLTTGDEAKKLHQEFNVGFNPGLGTNSQWIQVDENVAYQSMDGFGAALTDSAAWVITHTGEPTRTNLMNELFSTTSGIGISYVRLPLGGSEFVKDHWYTYDDILPGFTDTHLISFSIAHDQPYILPLLRQARNINPHLRIMASPWSAPAWMKSSSILTGGTLLSQYQQVYANYFVSFTQAYAEAGLPLDAITVQNEPLYTSTTYPTMWMDPYQQVEFVGQYLGPTFVAHQVNTKILIYDHNWDHYDYPLSILSNATARPYIAGTAWHAYSGTPEAQSWVHAAYPNKDIYFTEASGNFSATRSFSNDLEWGVHNVALGATQNWAKTVLYWNLALDGSRGPHQGGCDNCRGLITVYPTGTEKTTEYYVVGHLSKFVEPGAYRIGVNATPTGTLESVAFLNRDSIVLVVFNPAATFQAFDVRWLGQHFSYSLGAKSLITFRWPIYRTFLPLAAKDYRAPVSIQDFESDNGTPGDYFRDNWYMTSSFELVRVHTGLRALRSMAHASNIGSHGGSVTIYASANTPSDLSSGRELSIWVYDDHADTVELKLCATDTQCSSGLYSTMKSVPGTWTEIVWPLSGFADVDKTNVRSIQLYEWNDGIYYFDDVTWQ